MVLVVDDEPSICWAFERMLQEEGHDVVSASSAEEGLQLASQLQPRLILLDVRLPNEDGISALPKFIEATSGSPIVVMTAFGDLETAVAAVKRGASDYLVKPFRLEDARRACRKALAASGSNQHAGVVRRDVSQEPQLIGRSPAMQHVFRQIALVASSDLSVLITGETGTGKELVAAAIHRYSSRADAPYLPIAPVAFNEDLIESELFGHVKGAFTGATEDRAGLFERAEGGTVLLDEIGDLPINLQVKLLRVLEQGHYTRVGDMTPRRCNVRILAATHCDLHEAVRSGRFREDLYYRLNGLHIHLPPLRERTEDIQPLCEYFLQCIGSNSQAKPLSAELLDELGRRRWLGNIRELRNSVEHAAVLARGRALTIEDFPAEMSERISSSAGEGDPLERAISNWVAAKLAEQEPVDLYPQLIASIEPTILKQVLAHTGDNRAQAATILGIHRGTLREKLRQHGLDA